jgi:enoyl-CoA hydratase/carnithine racemase
MVSLKVLQAQVEAQVLTFTFNNPPLNLISPAFVEDLIRIIQDAEATSEYKVIVFKSAVADFFSAHVDMAGVLKLIEVIQHFLPGESLGMLYRPIQLHTSCNHCPSCRPCAWRRC